MHHCTPAWMTEQDCLKKQTNKEIASWKPEEIGPGLLPPILQLNSLMLLLKYMPLNGQITPDTVVPLTPTQHSACHGIHAKQVFVEQMQLETALTFLADTS